MRGTELLPPGFYIFAKFSAVLGFFTAGAFIVGLSYKGFKKLVGDEKAKKFRWIFIGINFPLLFIFVYIFFVIF